MKSLLAFRRVLLKLSGESLAPSHAFGIDPNNVLKIAHSLARIHRAGIQLGVVIGGGNIFRGTNLSSIGIPRVPADHMGMVGTLLNGISIQQALLALGIPVCLMTALECPQVAESFHWATAKASLEKGEVVLFVGGTGNPYFTTDSAAALRASEMGADVLLKATKVNGIYDKDPCQHEDAKKYDTLSYTQIIKDDLKIMDLTAVALCFKNQIPIFVFNMQRLIEDSVEELFVERGHGTWVSG